MNDSTRAVLNYLATFCGSMHHHTTLTIARAINLSGAVVRRAVARLVAGGLVERTEWRTVRVAGAKVGE